MGSKLSGLKSVSFWTLYSALKRRFYPVLRAVVNVLRP
jgi:hypothetical protein